MYFKHPIEENISSEVYLWVNHEVKKAAREDGRSAITARLFADEEEKKNNN